MCGRPVVVHAVHKSAIAFTHSPLQLRFADVYADVINYLLLTSRPRWRDCVNRQTHTHTHTRLTALCSGLPRLAGTIGKTNLDFTEARDSEWQWHQLGYMQVCTSLQTDNHASTPLLSFLQAGCPSCHPTNSVKALKH